MALVVNHVEDEVRSFVESFFAAFAAYAFGGTAGLSALRALGVGQSVAADDVGGQVAQFQQAFVAGKLAGEVGTDVVRRMTEPQLRRAVESAHAAQLTEADQALLESLTARSARSVQAQSSATLENLANIITSANQDWEGLLRSGRAGTTTAAREIARGRGLADVQRAIKDELAKAGYRTRRLVQTELSNYMQQGMVAGAKRDELVYKEPRANAEYHCMRLHLKRDGQPQLYRLRDVIGNSNVGRPPSGWVFTIGPVHPFCLLPGTRVSASGVQATTERWYEGEVVVLRTASGKRLSVTPNHPVLTRSGWVPAGLLHEGADLVRDLRPHWEPRAGHHVEDGPAPVEEVAEALRLSPTAAAVQVPVSPEHFHGDGAHDQVAVVRADGLLHYTSHAALREHLDQRRLVVASNLAFALAGLGALHLARHRHGGAAQGLVCLAHALLLDLEGFVPGPGLLGLGEPSGLYAGLGEPAPDGGSGRAEHARKAVLGLSGQVARDELVQVDREHYSGHVYNLQSWAGYYFAEGLATSNCYCILHRQSKEPRGGPNARMANRREKTLGGTLFPSGPKAQRPFRPPAAQGRRLGEVVVPVRTAAGEVVTLGGVRDPGPARRLAARPLPGELPPELRSTSRRIEESISGPKAKQGTADLDQLYREAAVADQELRARVSRLADDLGGEAVFPPGGQLKSRARVVEKAATKYGGDFSAITDFSRASLQFDRLEDVYGALGQLESRGMKVVRINDRFAQPTPEGYRDIILGVKMPNGHVAELQLHLRGILTVKEETHALYEAQRSIVAKAKEAGRDLTAAERGRIDDLVSQQQEIYGRAYGAAL